jgi:uncharacterized protein (DUF1330 family)
MKNYRFATALIGSFVLGIGTMQILHAQMKAPSYTIGLINVKDEEGYRKEFLPKAQELIKQNGGVYVAGGMNKTTPISGNPPPNRVVIIKFESLDAVKKWQAEGGLKVQEDIGAKYADFQTFAVEGVEQK